MFKLELSAEEAKVLAEALDSYLSDLRMEIADTDRLDFRRGLKSKKEILTRIMETVRTAF